MTRFGSISEMARKGLDLRVWCLRCARGREIRSDDVPPALARIRLDKVIARFRCNDCGESDTVILVPASRGGKAPVEPPTQEDDIPWARQVERFFHASRSKRKAVQNDSIDAAARIILERVRAKAAWDAYYAPPRLVTVDGKLVRGRPIRL